MFVGRNSTARSPIFSAEFRTDRTPEVENFCWRVEQQVRDGGFALISGESGTGKSITLRLLTRHLQTLPDIVVGAISRPQSRRPDFYREMGDIFSVPMKVNYHWSSFKDLRSCWEALVSSMLWRPVLLVDEAQEMQPEVLSELRLLSSTQLDSRSILTVILSGDDRLLDRLRLPELIPSSMEAKPTEIDKFRLKLPPDIPALPERPGSHPRDGPARS